MYIQDYGGDTYLVSEYGSAYIKGVLSFCNPNKSFQGGISVLQYSGKDPAKATSYDTKALEMHSVTISGTANAKAPNAILKVNADGELFWAPARSPST